MCREGIVVHAIRPLHSSSYACQSSVLHRDVEYTSIPLRTESDTRRVESSRANLWEPVRVAIEGPAARAAAVLALAWHPGGALIV